MKIYKYIGPQILEKAFREDGKIGFKCSYPQDYNDPYELFMALTSYADQEIVSYFQDIMTSIPRLPTSCFSKRPDVVPMWAHYAHQSRGFVIEIDEDELKKNLPDASLGDVDYKDEPEAIDAYNVGYALVRAKPRHTYMITRYAMSAAYFTKNACWGYEQERRLLVTNEDVETVESNMILYLPHSCVTAVIAGPHTTEEDQDACMAYCETVGCEYYQMKIGKSSTTPYFLNEGGWTYVFEDDELKEVDVCCEECGEPGEPVDDTLCNWCAMTNEDRGGAASRNPLRMLDELGLLGGYLEDVGRGGRK